MSVLAIQIRPRPRLRARTADEEAPATEFSYVFSSDGVMVRDTGRAPTLTLMHAEGATTMRVAGTLARALLPPEDTAVRWTATPVAAAAAERWLGAPVAVLTEPERILQALRTGWNLRQFELAPKH